jgi:hypothetical protein
VWKRPDKDDLISTDLTPKKPNGFFVAYRPSGSHLSHLFSHISHLADHFIRPSVGCIRLIIGRLGGTAKEVCWHRSYDDTNNGTDRSPYREKAVKSTHGSQGDYEDDTD